MSDERETCDPCPVWRNVALGIYGLAEYEKIKRAMQEKVFIDFLRNVAEINLYEPVLDERGRVYAERLVPHRLDKIVDAAKEALKKIEEAKE